MYVACKDETKKFNLKSGSYEELFKLIKEAGWSMELSNFNLWYQDDGDIISVDCQKDLSDAMQYKQIKRFNVGDQEQKQAPKITNNLFDDSVVGESMILPNGVNHLKSCSVCEKDIYGFLFEC